MRVKIVWFSLYVSFSTTYLKWVYLGYDWPQIVNGHGSMGTIYYLCLKTEHCERGQKKVHLYLKFKRCNKKGILTKYLLIYFLERHWLVKFPIIWLHESIKEAAQPDKFEPVLKKPTLTRYVILSLFHL